MFRHEVTTCLALCLLLLGVPRSIGAQGGGTERTAPVLAAPQWVGGSDARGKAQLTWIRSPAFSSVRVYRREAVPQAALRPLGETRDNVWVDETVQPGMTYYYRLVGIGPDGRESRPSSELHVRIGVVTRRPPAPPVWEGYLVVTDGVGLKWSARDGEDVIAWNVYRKSPPETEFRLVGSSRSTSFHDTRLEPDRLYVYALTALDSNFNETPYSQELPVLFARAQAPAGERAPRVWRVRRTRLVAAVSGGRDLPFERPADVAVGPVTENVYVADSGRNLVYVFTPGGSFQRTIGENQAGGSMFRNLLGVATDRDENLYVTDAGTGVVQAFNRQGRPGRRIDLSRPPGLGPTGLIDAAVGPDGRIFVVDNYNNQVSIVGHDGAMQAIGRAGAAGGEFSAPTFCSVDAEGNLVVADCLNGRVQVFSGSGAFLRAFGRAERGPGGFGRPKGVAVGARGEIYVADSWLNTVQVFDAEGRFVAILGDEAGRPLDLGSPNGVALGPGNRVYVAERLAARLQVRELIDVQ